MYKDRREDDFDGESEDNLDSLDSFDDTNKWIETCDFCGDEFGTGDMELIGSKFICKKCIKNNQSLFRR